MLHVRWELRVLLILSLTSALGTTASAENVCPPGTSDFCWQANQPMLSLQSMRLSLISALVMGAQGYSGWTPLSPTWQTSYTTACLNQSLAVREREGITNLKWFDKLDIISSDYKECNPEGAMRTIGAATGQPWVLKSFVRTEFLQSINLLVEAIRKYGSPVVIPYLGRWDHWITIVEVKGDIRGPLDYDLNEMTFYDGLLGLDLSGIGTLSSPGAPRVIASGGNFYAAYARVLTAKNAACDATKNCDTDPMDPWYGRYILLHSGTTSLSSPTSTKKPSFPAKPGVVLPGQPMNSALASSRVWDAVRRAGGSGPSLAAANTAVADPAVLVNGFWPSGAPWSYYLVGLRDSQNQLSGIIQLAAADGAFESLVTLPKAIRYSPVSLQEARQTASQAIKSDESLDAGLLTWDAREFVNGASSPSTPYYEFKIRSGDGSDTGSVARVVRHTGAFSGRQATSAPR